jgi:hypothetical protein
LLGGGIHHQRSAKGAKWNKNTGTERATAAIGSVFECCCCGSHLMSFPFFFFFHERKRTRHSPRKNFKKGKEKKIVFLWGGLCPGVFRDDEEKKKAKRKIKWEERRMENASLSDSVCPSYSFFFHSSIFSLLFSILL